MRTIPIISIVVLTLVVFSFSNCQAGSNEPDDLNPVGPRNEDFATLEAMEKDFMDAYDPLEHVSWDNGYIPGGSIVGFIVMNSLGMGVDRATLTAMNFPHFVIQTDVDHPTDTLYGLREDSVTKWLVRTIVIDHPLSREDIVLLEELSLENVTRSYSIRAMNSQRESILNQMIGQESDVPIHWVEVSPAN